MGFIYKISCPYSSKVYIGQTINSIQTRFQQHIRRDSGTKLAQAFQKYGIESFSVDLVEEVDNERLNEREIFWISHYDSYNHGYNMTPGGQTTVYAVEQTKKAVEKRDKDTFELLAVYPSLAEAARSLGLEGAENKRKNLTKCCHREIHEIYGFRWNFVGEPPDTIKMGMVRRIPVYMCDKNTKEILQKFDSAKAASIYLGKINGSQITACCKKRIPSAYGYFWRYVNE